jgi:hypothetical protein
MIDAGDVVHGVSFLVRPNELYALGFKSLANASRFFHSIHWDLQHDWQWNLSYGLVAFPTKKFRLRPTLPVSIYQEIQHRCLVCSTSRDAHMFSSIYLRLRRNNDTEPLSRSVQRSAQERAFERAAGTADN